MSPEDTPQRPLSRQPLPRRRMSIDGTLPVPSRPGPLDSRTISRPTLSPASEPEVPNLHPSQPSTDQNHYRPPRPVDGFVRPTAAPQQPTAQRPIPSPTPEPPVVEPSPAAGDGDDDDALFEDALAGIDTAISDESARYGDKSTDRQPPVAPVSMPSPAQPGEQSAPQPEAEQVAPAKPRRKKLKIPLPHIAWSRLRTPLLIILAAAICGGGAFAFLHYQSVQNNPVTVFDDALHAALSTSQVQVTNNGYGTVASTTTLDFTVPSNIISSNQATVSFGGAEAQVNAYGSAKNSYISYQKLPETTAAATTKTVQNSWVQIRQNGKQPHAVMAALANAADPRYQAFGPIVFGNFESKTSSQLRSFIAAHKIYKYDALKVKTTQLAGAKVFAFSVKPSLTYLKVLNDSAAASEGFPPADVQAAVDTLDGLKNATVTIYVNADGHQFAGIDIVKGGTTQTLRYSNYDKVSVPAEPQTKLQWADFSKTQLQIEAQAAAKQTAAQLDSRRQAKIAKLHQQLADYFTANTLYPTFVQLNDQGWVQDNLPGVDPDLFHDPLSDSLVLVTAPKANNLSYEAFAADQKSACDNLNQSCAHYRLSFILSNGQAYSIQDP